MRWDWLGRVRGLCLWEYVFVRERLLLSVSVGKRAWDGSRVLGVGKGRNYREDAYRSFCGNV